jgi:hypothetical protein
MEKMNKINSLLYLVNKYNNEIGNNDYCPPDSESERNERNSERYEILVDIILSEKEYSKEYLDSL